MPGVPCFRSVEPENLISIGMNFTLRSIAFVLTLPLFTNVLFAESEEFRGWEGMRVIHLDGRPQILRAGDIYGDGRDELVAVNTRQSRLDVYRWLPKERRAGPGEIDPDRPNELPMAPEIEILELPLEELPRDALLLEREGHPGRDILVLGASPNRVLQYRESDAEESGWEEIASWDLLPGTISSSKPLLLRPGTDSEPAELFMSFEEGVQRLLLEPGSRVRWFQPRERLNRRDWWLADFSGDGEPELVEWVRQQRQTLRWYQSMGGELLPARGLSERSFQAVEVLSLRDRPDQILLLGGARDGILRRYRIERDDASPVGSQQVLSLSGRASWSGFLLDGEPVLVAANSEQPRMEVFAFGDEGWIGRGSYPSVRGMRSLASPVAAPGTLLIWAEDAQDLYISRWENERLTYPVPMPQSQEVDERRIVALSRNADSVWWAQSVGDDLDVYYWPADTAEPVRTGFSGVGGNIAGVNRLAEDRVLLMEQYARNPKVAVLQENGTAALSEPSRLRGARLEEFFPLVLNGEAKVGRLADGVWQWLGEDLHAEDQIMLPEGLRMAAYVPLADGEAWVLEQGGRHLYRMRPDEAGIPRAEDRFALPGGSGLVEDPHLGLLLHSDDQVVRLAPGEPWHLALVESIDSRVGRPTGVREATIHRIFTTDLTGDGRNEVIFSDDRRHQLTALKLTGTGLEAMISWQVFEDLSYPYGMAATRQLQDEPRAIVGLDINGDGRRDLAMLSHDRLVVYLAREEDSDE